MNSQNQNEVLALLRDFLAARQTQQDTKAAYIHLSTSDDGYFEKQRAFRSADDRYEELFAQVILALQQAQVDDITDEVLDALGEDGVRSLRSLLSDRGLDQLLASTGNDLAGIISKYRKVSQLFTAARELNARRRQLELPDFEESLDRAPANVDEDAWREAVRLLGAAEEAVWAEDGNEDADPEDVMREAAFRVENKTRKRCDELGEKLVTVFRDLLDGGRFDLAVADLDPDLRRAAYELQRMVPQPQRQVQTKPEPRPVALAEPETDTETELN